jgi:hypothetical protein
MISIACSIPKRAGPDFLLPFLFSGIQKPCLPLRVFELTIAFKNKRASSAIFAIRAGGNALSCAYASEFCSKLVWKCAS